MMDIKIIINLFYKPSVFLTSLIAEDAGTLYFPINGGASFRKLSTSELQSCISAKLLSQMHYDDVGDNISSHNNALNEMTCIYWFWKNYDLSTLKYIGFNHYRRLFMPSDFADYHEYDFIASEHFKIESPCDSIKSQYELAHNAKDFEVCIDVLKKKSKAAADRFVEYCKSDVLYSPCNMFIMKTELFKQYCEFMFPLLFSLEKRISLKGRNAYQSRAIAFLSERLTSYWLTEKQKSGLKSKEIPIRVSA